MGELASIACVLPEHTVSQDETRELLPTLTSDERQAARVGRSSPLLVGPSCMGAVNHVSKAATPAAVMVYGARRGSASSPRVTFSISPSVTRRCNSR
jgi:hypothetical protein